MAQILGIEALLVATENLGKKELTGHNDGPFVRMIQRFVAGLSSWLDGQPWCCCFSTWCVYEAATRLGLRPAVPFMPKSASSSSLYAWHKSKGFLLQVPIPGCIGYLKETDPTTGKTHKHTFIVESLDHDSVNSIDGNWKNAVSRAKHPIVACDFGAIL